MTAQCEYTMEKSVQVYHMNLKEHKNYEQLTKRIGKNLLHPINVQMWEHFLKTQLAQVKIADHVFGAS